MGIHLDPKFYHQLIKDQKKLRALEAAGVDNWEGYSDAMEILKEETKGYEKVSGKSLSNLENSS